MLAKSLMQEIWATEISEYVHYSFRTLLREHVSMGNLKLNSKSLAVKTMNTEGC